MQQFNLGDYRGGRENLTPLLQTEMQLSEDKMKQMGAYGQIAASSAMQGKRANQLADRQFAMQSQLLSDKLAGEYQMRQLLAAQQAASSSAMYERQKADQATAYDQHFRQQQEEFNRQQGIISDREQTKHDWDVEAKSDAEAQARSDLHAAINGELEGIIGAHQQLLDATATDDPARAATEATINRLRQVQASDNIFLKKGYVSAMTGLGGNNPMQSRALGTYGAKPVAQQQPKAEAKGKIRRPLPQGFTLNGDEKYNQ